MTLYKTIADANGGTQVAMTADEEDEFIASQRAATAASTLAETIASAQAALDKSDITMLRCTENGIAVPTEWATYRTSLRAIIKTETGTLPVKPPYPEGT